MFKNLTNFGYKRNWKEAVGFYIAYCAFIFVLGMLFGGIASVLFGRVVNYDTSLRIGGIIAVISTLILSILIVKQKHLKSFGIILLIPISGILALFGGALLGVIPVAYLTTRSTPGATVQKASPPPQGHTALLP